MQFFTFCYFVHKMKPMVGLLGARFLTGTSCSSFLFLHVLVSQELDIIPYFCSSFLFLGIWILVAFSTWKFDMIITLGLASSSFLAIKIRVVLDSVQSGCRAKFPPNQTLWIYNERSETDCRNLSRIKLMWATLVRLGQDGESSMLPVNAYIGLHVSPNGTPF